MLRGDRGGLQSQPRLSHGSRGVADHRVARGTAVRQREIEPHQLEVEAEYVRVEDPQRLVEQLLARLVAVAHDDLPPRVHAVQGRTNGLAGASAGRPTQLRRDARAAVRDRADSGKNCGRRLQ